MLQEASQNAVYKLKSTYSYIQDNSGKKVESYKNSPTLSLVPTIAVTTEKTSSKTTTKTSTIQMFQDILKYTRSLTHTKSENKQDFEFICSNQIRKKTTLE